VSRRHAVALGGIVAAFALLFFVEGTVLQTAWMILKAMKRYRGFKA